MRNDFYAKLMIVACALAGCMAGFGINGLLVKQQENENAKDDTLLREEYDGVFFAGENTQIQLPPVDGEQEEEGLPTDVVLWPTPMALISTEPMLTPTQKPTVMPGALPSIGPTVTSVADLTQNPTRGPEPTPGGGATPVVTIPPVQSPTVTPALSPVPTPTALPTPTLVPAPEETQAITYPAQIFGQTPVINRTDEYITYFEFAMDLIAVVEEEIRERNLNETALFSKFMLKTLFCGIDIRGLCINNPIPREQAALAIHLAAEILNKPGTGTSAKSAGKYVGDIDVCSASERKAIAYLYEQGILNGYMVTGQRFLPESSLKESDGLLWMKRAKECWK